MLAKSVFYASILTKSIAHKVEVMLPIYARIFRKIMLHLCSPREFMLDYAAYYLVSNNDATFQPTHGHTDA